MNSNNAGRKRSLRFLLFVFLSDESTLTPGNMGNKMFFKIKVKAKQINLKLKAAHFVH